jgi:hypothetical protein
MGDKYIMLVDTLQEGSVSLVDLPLNEAQSVVSGINLTPYDAFSTWSWSWLNPGTRDSLAWMGTMGCTKPWWPWVYLTRLMGATTGYDFEDQYGNRTALKAIWTQALQIAKASRAPGIVVDLEPYIDSEHAVFLSAIETQWGLSEAEIKAGIVSVMGELIDVAHSEYPGCKLWFLMAPLNTSIYNPLGENVYYHWTKAALDRLVTLNSNVQIISGGEIEIGYTPASVADVAVKIATYKGYYAAHPEYHNHLLLGAPVCLWDNWGITTYWIHYHETDFLTLKEHYAKFVLLLDNFDWIWVYNESTVSQYQPWDATTALPYNALVRSMKARQEMLQIQATGAVYDMANALEILEKDYLGDLFINSAMSYEWFLL